MPQEPAEADPDFGLPKGVTAKSLDIATRTAWAEDTQNPQDTASAIANRFNDKRYPQDLMKIVTGKNQFAGYGSRLYKRMDTGGQAYSNIRANLLGMLTGNVKPTHNYTDFIAGTGGEAGKNIYSNPIQNRTPGVAASTTGGGPAPTTQPAPGGTLLGQQTLMQ